MCVRLYGTELIWIFGVFSVLLFYPRDEYVYLIQHSIKCQTFMLAFWRLLICENVRGPSVCVWVYVSRKKRQTNRFKMLKDTQWREKQAKNTTTQQKVIWKIALGKSAKQQQQPQCSIRAIRCVVIACSTLVSVCKIVTHKSGVCYVCMVNAREKSKEKHVDANDSITTATQHYDAHHHISLARRRRSSPIAKIQHTHTSRSSVVAVCEIFSLLLIPFIRINRFAPHK